MPDRASPEGRVDLKWWHVALLTALDETNGFTAGTIGKAVWKNSTAREAASTASPHLKKLAKWGLATTIDDKRPMIWITTPAGRAALSTLTGDRHG